MTSGQSFTSKKLLLHICCAPCSIEVIESLAKAGYEIYGYFYNPNIHPQAEYEKRRDSVIQYLDSLNFQYEIATHNEAEYFDAIGEVKQGKARCTLCYDLRLSKSAIRAKTLGFKEYSTTLLFNPHKDFEFIAEIGKKNAAQNQIQFVFPELKHDYWGNKAKAKELEMYVQKYCGCKFSMNNRRET